MCSITFDQLANVLKEKKMPTIMESLRALVVPPARTYVASVALVTMIVFYAHSRWSTRNQVPRKAIPGPKVNGVISTIVPLINIMRNQMASKTLLMFQLVCGYTHVFRKEGLWLFSSWMKPIVLLYKPETVEAVLSNPEILEKGFEYKLLSDWLKEGLLTSKGDKWRKRRKLLTPAFHFRILDQYIPVFNEQSRIFANKIANAMKCQSWVDIAPLTSLCTLDIICETAMGMKINAQENSNSAYVRALHAACKAAIERLLRPWLWSDFIYYLTSEGKKFKRNLLIMDSFTRQVICERMFERDDYLNRKSLDDVIEFLENEETSWQTKKRLALLDLLVDAHFRNPFFTFEDVAEEIDNFMFAGHDTTSSGLSWALYMVGLHPEVQRKVYEEIVEVLGEDLDTPITMDDIKNLKYLECVLKETRRLLPPTPFIARELNEDTDINGYIIPKGTNCGILIYMLHRDPEVFPNPEVFDPDRFKLSNSTGRHPYAYVPFSAGPRNCIGQKFASLEAITVMAQILRRFEVKSKDPLDKLHIVDELVIRSESGLKMSFKERAAFKHDSSDDDPIVRRNKSSLKDNSRSY